MNASTDRLTTADRRDLRAVLAFVYARRAAAPATALAAVRAVRGIFHAAYRGTPTTTVARTAAFVLAELADFLIFGIGAAPISAADARALRAGADALLRIGAGADGGGFRPRLAHADIVRALAPPN